MVIWLALLVLVFTDCAGSILLAQGMRQVGEIKLSRPQQMVKSFRRAAQNLRLWLGVLNMTIAFFMLIFLLSQADISFVIPATALTEPLNMLGARIFLNEKVSSLRWTSILFIGVGVALISIN